MDLHGRVPSWQVDDGITIGVIASAAKAIWLATDAAADCDVVGASSP
jgi:hypothetical protein